MPWSAAERNGHTYGRQSVKQARDSNLELYRIIVMLLIVAHHYVVNSGVTGVMEFEPLKSKSVFLNLFGAWGKTGINCFMLITGYFICTSSISVKKFLKILFQVKFYSIVIYVIFVLTGYESVSIMGIVNAIIPIRNIGTNFTNCFEMFYLLIPLLNILIKNMNKQQHEYLLMVAGFIYIFLGSFRQVTMNYVSWFIVLYFIASYIRLYPRKIYKNTKLWGITTVGLLALASLSVILGLWTGKWTYFFVSDSNTVLAVILGVCSFLLFKNLKMGYCKVINYIAASTFGVLQIHANSDTMRKWLWGTLLNVKGTFANDFGYVCVHAVLSVIIIFAVCILIDKFRIRFIEKPVFSYLDRFHWVNKRIE